MIDKLSVGLGNQQRRSVGDGGARRKGTVCSKIGRPSGELGRG